MKMSNKIDLHLKELVCKTDLHMKGFALGLVLKQRQKELGNGLFEGLVVCYLSSFFFQKVSFCRICRNRTTKSAIPYKN